MKEDVVANSILFFCEKKELTTLFVICYNDDNKSCHYDKKISQGGSAYAAI